MVEDGVPIEDGASKGTSAARSAQEQVPNSVAEGSGLGRGAEARSARRTTEGDRHDLALGLAGLYLRGEERAVRQITSWEVRIA